MKILIFSRVAVRQLFLKRRAKIIRTARRVNSGIDRIERQELAMLQRRSGTLVSNRSELLIYDEVIVRLE